MQLIRYCEAKIGQKVAKSGSFPEGVIVDIKQGNGKGHGEGPLFSITLDNGDVWHGWAERFIKIIE